MAVACYRAPETPWDPNMAGRFMDGLDRGDPATRRVFHLIIDAGLLGKPISATDLADKAGDLRSPMRTLTMRAKRLWQNAPPFTMWVSEHVRWYHMEGEMAAFLDGWRAEKAREQQPQHIPTEVQDG